MRMASSVLQVTKAIFYNHISVFISATVEILSHDAATLRPPTLSALSLLLTRMFTLAPSPKAFVDAGGCGVVVSLMSSLQVFSTPYCPHLCAHFSPFQCSLHAALLLPALQRHC
jgi:hypothetical protein